MRIHLNIINMMAIQLLVIVYGSDAEGEVQN